MKKALIIVFIMCLLGMIFLSGSIGVFFEPVEVFNKAIVVAILIIAFIICCLYRKNKASSNRDCCWDFVKAHLGSE